MSDPKSSSGGIGFCGLLTIVFITLKLCKVIDWSWWWVLSPAWIPAGIALLTLIAMGIFYLANRKKTKNKLKSLGLEDMWNNSRKSKWQERMEQMQEAQKKRV